jgi:WD40 repeat protein
MVLRFVPGVLLGLAGVSFTGAGTTAAADPSRTVTLPVAASSSDGASVECVVQCGPAYPVVALAFRADGKVLAMGGYQEVLLWDLEQARLANRIGAGKLRGFVHAVALIAEGQTLVVGDGEPGQSGSVTLWNTKTGQRTAEFREPRQEVLCLAVSPDGKRLAAGDADAQVRVWNLADRKLVKTIQSHKGRVLAVAFCGDGKRLVTAGHDQSIQIWDVENWKQVMRYDVGGPVHGLALSTDGNTILGAVGGADEWAIRTGRVDQDLQQLAKRKASARLTSSGTGMPLDIVWPAEGANAYVACHDHTIRTYLLSSGNFSRTFSGHSDWVYSLAATPDGGKLASGSADGTVKLWNPVAGKSVATLLQLSAGTDDWAIVTAQGYAATSDEQAVTWKTEDASTSPAQLAERYRQPDEVRQAVAATHVPEAGSARKDKSAKDKSSKGKPGKNKAKG